MFFSALVLKWARICPYASFSASNKDTYTITLQGLLSLILITIFNFSALSFLKPMYLGPIFFSLLLCSKTPLQARRCFFSASVLK